MYSRILVPIDGSPTARAGLQEAIRLARGWGVKLRLVHVVDSLSLKQALLPARITSETIRSMQSAGQTALEDARRMAEGENIATQTALRIPAKGSVADMIVAEASRWKADLVVMGTHGHRGSLAVGSTARGVIRSAKPPVLLVTPASSGAKRP